MRKNKHPNVLEKRKKILHLEKMINKKTREKIKDLYTKLLLPHEAALIDDMLGMMTDPEHVAHFLLGGHIQLEGDNGNMYNKWTEKFRPKQGTNGEHIPGSRKNRISSHVSIDQQYSVSGPVVKEALFGTRLQDPNNKNSSKYTWIQLEKNPVGGYKEFKESPFAFMVNVILHMLDYFDYKINKRNIGPYGKSKYTEADPLKIDVSELSPELADKRSKLWKVIILDRKGDITDLESQMQEVGIKIPDGHTMTYK